MYMFFSEWEITVLWWALKLQSGNLSLKRPYAKDQICLKAMKTIANIHTHRMYE